MWFSFLLGLTLVSSAQAASAPVENLLSFFASTCPSEGAWTQAALGKASALRNALNDLSQDPDCQALSSESLSANAIYSSLTVLNQQIAGSTSEVSLIAQEQAVLTSMASTTNPAAITDLQRLLIELDAKVVTTKSDEVSSVQAVAANQLVASTHNLVQQAVNNQKCLLKRPGLWAGLGALVANVGSAVTAINPGFGLGASATGTLMSDMVNLFHKRDLTKGIRKLNQASIQPEAISCVLESLTDDYCRAQDAVVAIDWAQAHRVRRDYPLDSPLYGLGLLDREVVNFARWLGTVKVARLAQSSADASRAQEFRNQEAYYLSSPDLVSGTFSNYRNQLDGVLDIERRWPIIRTMIVELVSKIGAPPEYSTSSNIANPLFQTKNRNEAEFFLVGIDVNKLPKPNNNIPIFESSFSPIDLETAKPPQTLKTDIKDIQAQFDSWFSDTKVLVDNQRAQILQPDVEGTLEGAFSKTQDYGRAPLASKGEPVVNEVSPYQSLIVITDYLQEQLRQNPNQSESFYYLPDTIARLTKIRLDLESLHQPAQKFTSKDYSEILSGVYTEANLQHGSLFLQNRITDHINNALVRYLSDPLHSADNAPILAQTLASERMTDILTKTNPKGDRGLVREDIMNSITVVLPTLNAFVDTFQREIKGVLEFLRRQEALYGGKTGEIFRYKRAKICLMMTNLATWPKKVPYELCQGTSFVTLADGPHSPVLTSSYMAKAVDDRACGYYQLQRATLIHQAKLDFISR